MLITIKGYRHMPINLRNGIHNLRMLLRNDSFKLLENQRFWQQIRPFLYFVHSKN